MGVSIHDVLRAANGLAGCDLRRDDRRQQPSRIRLAAYVVARKRTGKGLTQIAKVFQRNHATVIYGSLRADPKLVAIVDGCLPVTGTSTEGEAS